MSYIAYGGLGIAHLKYASLAAFKVQVALAARGRGIARSTSGPATTASTRR